MYTDFQDACLAVGRCRVRHHNNLTSEIVMGVGRATQATKCFLCGKCLMKIIGVERQAQTEHGNHLMAELLLVTPCDPCGKYCKENENKQ